MGETNNVVKTLGSSQTRGAHADNENINVAVRYVMVSMNSSDAQAIVNNITKPMAVARRANIRVSHSECWS